MIESDSCFQSLLWLLIFLPRGATLFLHQPSTHHTILIPASHTLHNSVMCALSKNYIIEGYLTHSVNLSSGSSSSVDIKQLFGSVSLPDDTSVVLHQSRSEKSLAAIVGGQAALVVQIKKEGSTWEAVGRHAFSYAKGHALAASTDKNGNELWVHLRTVDVAEKGEGQLVADLLSTDSDRSAQFKIPTYSRIQNGEPTLAFLNPYVRKDGSNGLRALVSTRSSTVCMIQQEFVVWEVQGGLAHTLQADFVNIPVPPPPHNEMFDVNHSSINPFLKLITRFSADAEDIIQGAIALFKGKLPVGGHSSEQLAWDTEGISLKHDMNGDRFGFKKLVISLSKAGTVYAIHTQTGAIVWQKFLCDAQTPDVELQRMFVTRPVGPPDSVGDVQIVVVGKNVENNRGVLWWINPLLGIVTGKKELDARIVHAALLPILTEDHTKMVMLIDEALNARVIPDTPAGHNLLSKRYKSIFFYLSSETGLQGYALSAKPAREQGKFEFKAVEAWAVMMPESEKIIAMHHHSSEESVKAAGRVLGNRAVLLKYLNVNLVAVATETPGTGRNKEPSVRVYLVDTVVGAILHSAVHRDASGPVKIVQAENVVLYNFWNARKQRSELAVMELYENSKQEVSSAAQMFMLNETTMSSLNAEKPWVLGQSYILSAGIKSMAVTNTLLGITTRNFILGLSSDQVFSLEKRLVDPRRPTSKPTPEDQEEGLVPYAPIIPLNPTHMLSYNNTVYNLRGISVSPARIESTCHMFAFGLDMFYSRVSPAKAYDCLGDDFNYATLAVSVIGLGILTQAASWFLGKRELSQAWN